MRPSATGDLVGHWLEIDVAHVSASPARVARGVVLKVPARSAFLRGRVVDAEGQPMHAAIVEAAPLRFGVASRREGVPTLSDGNGAFVFDALSTGPYAVIAAAPGYSTVEMKDVVVPGGDIVVKMELSAALEGVVKDDRGAPSALATVSVSLDAEGQKPTSVRCDENGMWRASDLRPGRYRINAVSANAASVGEATAEVFSGKSTAIDVLLSPGRRVIGKVASFGTGAPVAGARVTVATEQGEGFSLSRADGSFEVVGLPTKTSSVRLGVEESLSRSLEEYFADLSSAQGELDVGTLLLVPQSGDPQLGSRGAQGLEVRGTPRELHILDVAVGSAAQIAGFVAGARVLSIDRKRAGGIGRHGFETLLSSGKSVELEVVLAQSNASQLLVLPAAGK